MTIWFYPHPLSADALKEALTHQEFMMPVAGMLPDLARAHSTDHIKEWLDQLFPEMTPEEKTKKADHCWKMVHELHIEDYLVIPIVGQNLLALAEITTPYIYETRGDAIVHGWSVKWLAEDISPAGLPALVKLFSQTEITEISDERALTVLRPHIPALRRPAIAFFKWLSIAILIFELIYFWPH